MSYYYDGNGRNYQFKPKEVVHEHQQLTMSIIVWSKRKGRDSNGVAVERLMVVELDNDMQLKPSTWRGLEGRGDAKNGQGKARGSPERKLLKGDDGGRSWETRRRHDDSPLEGRNQVREKERNQVRVLEEETKWCILTRTSWPRFNGNNGDHGVGRQSTCAGAKDDDSVLEN